MDKLRILFFDIDGVVCTLRSHLAFGDKGGLMQAWDVTCCQMIRRICAKNNFKIVISSSWRNSVGRLKVLDYYIALYGLIDHCYKFPDRITGSEREEVDNEWKTPRLGYVKGKTRGLEIQDWLSRHPEVTEYLIIDDDSDFLDEQKPFHIKTDSDEGFSSKNFIDCCNIIDKWNGVKND